MSLYFIIALAFLIVYFVDSKITFWLIKKVFNNQNVDRSAVKISSITHSFLMPFLMALFWIMQEKYRHEVSFDGSTWTAMFLIILFVDSVIMRFIKISNDDFKNFGINLVRLFITWPIFIFLFFFAVIINIQF